MKTKFLLLVAVLSLSLTACHKETDTPAPDCSQDTKVAALLALSKSDLLIVASVNAANVRTINGVTYETRWCKVSPDYNGGLKLTAAGEFVAASANMDLIANKLREELSTCRCGF
jgi:hypothetical protein